MNCPEEIRKYYGGFEEMKSKIVYDASENTNDEEKTVIQESGLSEKDIAKFKRKMDRLLDYLRGLAEKANHSEETYQMIQEGLMDVVEWFIPIR
jgi:t-SNARE complex subunit (syntaxin)